MIWYLTLLLLSISAYMAWRYSREPVDPDWALFNLSTFTGSWYGRDFVDVKTPMIHIYYWIIGKIVGPNVARVVFTHHFLTGGLGAVYYALTLDWWGALAYTVLINSGWLFAFHGNVGQQPAYLILFGLVVQDPYLATIFLVAALLFEPKLLLSIAAVVVIKALYLPVGIILVIGVILAIILRFTKPEWWGWIWESSVKLPGQLNKRRQNGQYHYPWVPWFTSNPMMYLIPWLGMSILAKPDWQFWLPAALYFLVICYGRVIRPNHLIPLIPWIVISGMDAQYILVMVLADLLASGLYLGDIWARFYPGLADSNKEARIIGGFLKDKPGSLWVNGIHTSVYIWARKPVQFGMTEQAEIREHTDRREGMRMKWRKNPPDWVVHYPGNGIDFTGAGYSHKQTSTLGTTIYKRLT